MCEIVIIKQTLNTYKVVVNAQDVTEHIVVLQPSYLQQLTNGKVSDDMLIKYSFEFLLTKESNTSILRSFDLSVIANYFPDYEHAIKLML
jgi:hypothetical protein